MNETEFGDNWDISFDIESSEDVIMVDTKEGDTVYLSRSDLQEMMDALI